MSASAQLVPALGGRARSRARWNISLFRYRDHGTGFGRVLCGFEVPAPERAEFAVALERLGFNHSPVGESPVTRFLMAGR